MSQYPPCPPPFASAAPPPLKQPSMLAWWAAFPAGAFLVCQVIFGWANAKAGATSPDYAISYLVGGIIGGLLISMLPAWVVYRIAGRSQLGGSITFSVLMVLFTLTVISQSLGAPQAKRVVKEVMDSLRAKENLAYDDMQTSKASFRNGLRGIENQDEIDRRLAVLDRAIASNNAMLDAGDGAHDTLSRRLGESRVSGWQRDRVLAQFDKEYNWTAGRRVYTSNADLFAAMRNCYLFLHQNEADWTYDPQSNRVLFKSTGRLDEFHKLQQKIIDASKEQSQIHS